MKKVFIACFCALLLICCKKSTLPAITSIEYKIDGIQVQINGDIDSSNRDQNTGFYYGCYAIKYVGSTFYGISGESKSNGMLLLILTQDSLLATTYSGGSITVSFVFKDTVYGVIHANDSLSLNISRHSNGSVDGTFSGVISNANSVQKTISQGKFTNVKVY